MNKTVVSVLALVVLVLSSISLVGGNAEGADEKPLDEERDYTHTVFGEFGTATWCGYCKYAHGALKNIYAGGWHPFYYVSMVDDENVHADTRTSDYNVYGFPTVWFDGGYEVDVGAGSVSGAMATYNSSIISCGNRAVPDIHATLDVQWLGNATMNIQASVQNNESGAYDGRLRVYVTEIESSMGWTDTWGYPYTFPFLDYAFNQEITVPGGGTWQNTTTWNGNNYNDGHGNDFGGITQNNTMVIAAVFNDTWHQGYSQPPSSNPFDAYYVDEATAAAPGNVSDSTPPDIGLITATPSQQDMYGHVNLTVNVTDNAGVDVVKAIINYPDGSSVNETMTQVAGTDTYSYNTTYDLPGDYLVQIWARDVNGNTNTSCCPFYFSITDIIPPQVAGVTATPASQYAGEHVNITAQVTDNVGISTVAVNVTGPGGGHTNATMTRISGTDTYYHNATYFAPGTYSFTAWCDDWEGNSNMSGTNSFTIMDATVDLSFSTGWNLMTVPVVNDYSASSLGAAIPGCNIVAYWNASAGMFQSYVVGITPGDGFAIEDGVGYFVYVNTSGTFSVTGAPLSSVAVDLYQGWNTIGWYNVNATSASSLAPAVPSCSIAAYWNASSSTFESYTVGVTPPPGFAITQGMGVFVYVTAPGVWTGQG
jgi:hypothetical protein